MRATVSQPRARFAAVVLPAPLAAGVLAASQQFVEPMFDVLLDLALNTPSRFQASHPGGSRSRCAIDVDAAARKMQRVRPSIHFQVVFAR